MKKIIAIIGNANIEDDMKKQKIAFELGKLIVDNGYILVNGGLGGVMEYASRGAKTSKNYTQNSVIGVLPDYNSDKANKYVDISIPTGLGLARNLILISMSNAVIAIGGGAGTLNEISAAWQMNKLLIALQVSGWSEKLCGKSLDERRNDIIYCAKNPQEAIKIIDSKISYYQIRKFTGVNKPRISINKARKIIMEYFDIKNKLEFLGKGSEGFVFNDEENVYKLIDRSKQPLELYWILSSLEERLKKINNIYGIPKFEVSLLNNNIFIKYKFEKTDDFTRKSNIHIDKFINLLKEFHKIGYVLADFKPQNLRITQKDDLLIIDIGKSFIPYSSALFKSMCRRAFVTYKLQNKLSNPQDFKKYLSAVNKDEDFSLLNEFGLKEKEISKEFKNFYKKINTTNKKDILNPIVKDIFQNNIKVKSVFDYGSGYGDISHLLRNQDLSVVIYEPDQDVINKYKEKYYKGIEILNYSQVKKLIINNEKFDSVLCSLVLCHPLANTIQERLNIIDQIMEDITALSKKYIIIVICNPLYTYQTCSSLQERILPNNFEYKNETKFIKKIYSSEKERFDIHRPLSFYENLFNKYKLNIKEIIQTNDKEKNTIGIYNSDFMVFVLEKR